MVGLTARAASTANFKAISDSLLQLESCLPPNGYIDPGETNTVVFVIQNTHGDVLKNVKANLVGDVDAAILPVTGQQSVGDVAKDGVITLQFTFRANGTCGNILTPTIHLTSDTIAAEDLTFSGNNDNGASLQFQLGATVPTTYSFSNGNGITIPDTFGDNTKLGRASTYPSVINVSGVPNVSGITGERVKGVSVTLNNLSFGWSPYLQVLLVGPQGQAVPLIAGAGGQTTSTAPVNGVNVTISSSGSVQLPHGVGASQITTGTYKPSNFALSFGASDFPDAPASTTFSADLSAFNDIDATGNWKLFIQNRQSGFTGQVAGGWTLNLTTTKIVCCAAGQTFPVVGSMGDTSINEDTATSDAPLTIASFKVFDIENASSLDSINLSATSSNPSVVDASNLFFDNISGSNPARTLKIKHSETHAFGDTIITVTATDPQGHTATTSFKLTVKFVNHNPGITQVLNQQVNVGQSTPALPFSVSDVEDVATSILVTANSSDTTIVPVNNIFISGNPPNGSASRTVTVTPASTSTSGSATITLTAHDSNGGSTDMSFLVAFTAVSGHPTITPISAQTVKEDAILTVPFNVRSASTTPASQLQVTVLQDDNPTAFAPSNGIVFGGSDTSRTITFTPNPALTADTTASLILQVTDPSTGLTSQTPAFNVTVQFVNKKPTISGIANQVINQGTTTGTGALAFTVNDVETAAAALAVTASSSNPTVVPNDNAHLVITNPGTNGGKDRTINVIPAAGQFGAAVITVTVTDGNGGSTSTSFVVTVNAVNQAPTLSNPGDMTILEDSGAAITDSKAHTITISLPNINPGAPGEWNQTVSIVATSYNPGVLSVVKVDPASQGPFSVDAGGNIINKTSTLVLTLQPHANTCGKDPVKITLDLRDNGGTDNGGKNSSTYTFFVTVAPINQQLSFTVNPNNAVDLNNVPKNQALAIPLSVSDTHDGVTETPTPLVSVVGSLTSSDPLNVVQGILTDPLNSKLTLVLNPLFTNTVNKAQLPYTLSFKAVATDQSVGCGTPTTSVTANFTIVIKDIEPATIAVSPTTVTTDEDVVGLTVLSIHDNHDITAELRPLQALPPTCAGSSGYSQELSAHSDNQTLLPDANILFGNLSTSDSFNGARTVAIVPALHKFGTANVTVTAVDDECIVSSTTFTVTVREVPHPPTIAMSSATPVVVDENKVTADSSKDSKLLEFNVDDVDTGASSVTVTGDSSDHNVVPVANIVVGNQGASGTLRTLTITPAPNTFGTNITITLTAKDPGGLVTSTTFQLTVRHINQPPTLDQPSNMSVPEDAGQQTPVLTGISPGPSNEQSGPAAQGVVITWTARDKGTRTDSNDGSNTLITNGSGVNTITGGDLDLGNGKATLRFTPIAHASGTATIYVTVTDVPNVNEDATADNTKPKSITKSFDVAIAFANHLPTISFASGSSVTSTTVNITRDNNGNPVPSGIIPIYLSDVEQSSGTGLSLSAVSSNPILVPNDTAHLQLGGSGNNRGLVILPANGQIGGSAVVTLTVTDQNGGTATATINVNVPNSEAPSITAIPNQTIHVNQFTDLLFFTVSDAKTPADQLQVFASNSSNTLLVPLSSGNIQFGGTGSSRALIILPAKDQTGSSVITITVKDADGNTSSTSFTLTVLGAPPTISPVPLTDQQVGLGQQGPAQTVTVGSANTFPGFLTVTGTSSNTNVVQNVFVLGNSATRTVSVLAGNTAGTALVTVTVSDNSGQTASTTFNVTVLDNNTPPTIGPLPLPDQNALVGQSIPLISFLVNDKETPVGSLNVTATSSNTNLVPNTTSALLVLSNPSTPGSRSLLITPTTNAKGTAVITVTVTDGGNKTATASFNLTINDRIVPNDFNGDGVPDLLLEDNSGFVGAWFMSGDVVKSSTFLNPKNTGDAGWRIVDSGDFNGDGKPDILFQYTDGSVAVWTMTNGVTMASGQFLDPSNAGTPSWKAVAVADFNKDGKSDILFQNSNGDLAIWYMGDNLKVSSVAPLKPNNPGDPGWKAVAVGDFNGDGNVDVIFQHTDGTLGVWYLIGGNNVLFTALLNPTTTASNGDASWRVVGSIDLNGDGKPDLLLQNNKTHDVGIWYMNGPNLILGKLLTPSNPGGTWQVVAP